MSNAELTILVVLSHGERYGRDIMQRASELTTAQPIAAGGFYTALGRMESKGLIVGRWGDEHESGAGARRRYFTLTPAGREALRGVRRILKQAKG